MLNRAKFPIALALATAAALVAAPAASAGKGKEAGGNAHYRYKVVGFQYKSIGDLTADRNPGFCNPAESQSWTGRVLGQTADLALASGTGKLDILSKGSDGRVYAGTQVESTMSNAEHTQVIACDMGQPSDFAATPCSGETKLAPVHAEIYLDAGVGDRIRVTPQFRVNSGHGTGWIDNRLVCVNRYDFGASQWPSATAPQVQKCRPYFLPLSRFTGKKATLPFSVASCTSFSQKPPEGTIATTFLSMGQVSGVIKLKRTRHWGG